MLLFSITFLEGKAVCTLIHRRVRFVSAYCDAVEGAVIGRIGVVPAVLHGTFDAFVEIHDIYLLNKYGFIYYYFRDDIKIFNDLSKNHGF